MTERETYPRPPRTITDEENRDVEIRAFTDEAYEPLVEMYLDFNPEDRAQGIPPIDEAGIREWLDIVTDGECFNVVGWHGDRAVGHAMLVGDQKGGYELAIFVLQDYQGAYIGTELLRTVLGLGQESGVEHVWLSVERWNKPAVRLYEKIGFETTESANFELEMTLEI